MLIFGILLPGMKKKETQLLGIPEEISETKKEEAPKFKEETELKKRFKEKEEEFLKKYPNEPWI